MATSKKRKKKKIRIFYPIYFLLMIAAVGAVFVICDMIRENLTAYEASQVCGRGRCEDVPG